MTCFTREKTKQNKKTTNIWHISTRGQKVQVCNYVTVWPGLEADCHEPGHGHHCLITEQLGENEELLICINPELCQY